MVAWKVVASVALMASLALAGCTSSDKPAEKSRVPDAAEGPVMEEGQADASAQDEPQASEPGSTPQEPPQGEPPQGSGQGGEKPAEAPANQGQTTVYESRLDILVDDQFLVLPDLASVLSVQFEVAHPYQTLEVIGAYPLPAYADVLFVSVEDPDGKVIVNYSSIDAYAVVYGVGGSTQAMPMGYAYDIPLGTYTLNVWGAGTTPVDIEVRGYLGASMDFSFKNVVTNAEDKVANYRGKVVLIDLMATWCSPCHKAMPGLKEIREDYEGQVEILSIDIDDSETDAELRDMREQYEAEWPFGFDHKGEAWDAFGTGWIPSFAIVDQHGVLLFRHIGEVDESELRRIIDYAIEARSE
jgi:thiol-disulfide isomerase/thioredoxin